MSGTKEVSIGSRADAGLRAVSRSAAEPTEHAAEGNRFVADCLLDALETTGKLLRHVVLFKFKPEATPEQVQEVVTAFGSLKGKIDLIVDFEWGTDVSVENLAAGYTHCFFASFRDAASRDTYLPHPAHQEFVKLVGPRIDKVLVVDYFANR